MKFVTFSTCFCLLIFGAQADVNELVKKNPNEIQTCIVLTTNREENHSATEELLSEEVTTVAAAVPRDQQQDPGHPDYRGPYHYTKPKVELEYAVPDVKPEGRDLELPKKDYLPPSVEEEDEEEENDVPPEGRNEEFPKKEYLPPVVEENKLKRNVHFGRKLL